MKQFQGVWFPDHEVHMPEWMGKNGEIVNGRGTYQIKKLRASLEYVKKFRTAIDIGSHVGLWSMQLVPRFDLLHAFEPVAEHRACFDLNLGEATGPAGKIKGSVNLFACALGATAGTVTMRVPAGSSGGTHAKEMRQTPYVDPHSPDESDSGDGAVKLCRLDDVLPDTDDVDFMKLDCEGYEMFALQGGEHLIRRCMPVICVEQKPGRSQRFGLPERGAVEYLQGLGYKLAKEMSGDFIMVPA
jgi:FkbM family methyltransferase